MPFVNRTFPDIVRDILTNLTNGVTQELHRVTYDPAARPPQLPTITLLRRPVARVSIVEGLVVPKAAVNGSGLAPEPVPYTFTLNDYEFVQDPRDPDDKSTIRFLPFGRRPAPDTDVRVNYYPRGVDASPINDVNVGSVVRTLVEAMSRELATIYAQLNLAYDSAYVSTAEGRSLERVVELLGYERFRAGRPVGTVRFSRRTGSLGNITIPAGTPVTDAQDKIRYETAEPHSMLAGESTAEVRVRGTTDRTPLVEIGKLSVVQETIAGIDTVTNERPTTHASDDESDAELRTRTRDALLAANKGTVESIREGLLQMNEVRDARIEEMPNGIPGEIRVLVSVADGAAGPAAEPGKLPARILARIEELRPAGVRVITGPAGSVALAARVELVLAGSQLPAARVDAVHKDVKKKLISAVKSLAVGQKVRNKPLVAALLGDEALADVTLTLGEKGAAPQPPGADFAPPDDAQVTLADGDITFGADTFDRPAGDGQPVVVEVRATLTAIPQTGIAPESVQPAILAKLKAYFASLPAGASVKADALLNALRDDTKYAIDPSRLQVTLTSQDQFVQVAQGGPAFSAQPGQTFNVTAAEVATA